MGARGVKARRQQRERGSQFKLPCRFGGSPPSPSPLVVTFTLCPAGLTVLGGAVVRPRRRWCVLGAAVRGPDAGNPGAGPGRGLLVLATARSYRAYLASSPSGGPLALVCRLYGQGALLRPRRSRRPCRAGCRRGRSLDGRWPSSDPLRC